MIKNFFDKAPKNAIQGINNENSSGDYIYNTKNCNDCYSVVNSEDCKFVYDCGYAKDCYDVNFFGQVRGIQNCYECHEIGHGVQNIYMSDDIIDGCNNIYYSKDCTTSNNLFGCIGLGHSQYCILNKQYSKEEYKSILPKIIQHMKNTGEWGNFFPIELSPFCYNETTAQNYYPLSKSEVLEKGWKWKDDFIQAKYQGPKYDIPDSIHDTHDEVLNKILECEKCKKNFRIVKPELSFYKKMNIAIPQNCPNCRYNKRVSSSNSRELFLHKCDNCNVDIKTSQNPQNSNEIYCNKCYLNIVK